MAMNKWVKRKWLRALKSGEYEKGRGALCKYDTPTPEYCCLGVLAEEMVPEFVVERSNRARIGDHLDFGYLPDDLAILWGLDKDTQQRLSTVNDQTVDFAPVIAYIEKNL